MLSYSFTSMASAKDGAQLAGVKAVQPGHPLRGALRIAPALNQPDAETRDIPAPGTVWLDERLTSALGVNVGDEIGLGNSRFRVAAVLTFESDRGANFFSLLPRLMMHADDLPATGLIQVGSRVTYRLHIAGETQAVGSFQKWAQSRLQRGRVAGRHQQRPARGAQRAGAGAEVPAPGGAAGGGAGGGGGGPGGAPLHAAPHGRLRRDALPGRAGSPRSRACTSSSSCCSG
ncbi:MAG: hypothetical protein MZW92_49845 [Comamonadaceae bacterium]|nr:hypothetical protein [Comamonadaceae bacterium]